MPITTVLFLEMLGAVFLLGGPKEALGNYLFFLECSVPWQIL